MRKDIEILIANGWAIELKPTVPLVPNAEIRALVHRRGKSFVKFGSNPKLLIKQLFADCSEYDPMVASEWYR